MVDEVKSAEKLVKWRWIHRVLYIFQLIAYFSFVAVMVMRVIKPTDQIKDICFYLGALLCVLLFVGSLVKWRYDFLTTMDRKRKVHQIQNTSEGI